MDLKVNMKLLPMKAHYFLFNAGLAPLIPFIPTICRQLGISQIGVGLMFSIFPFDGLAVKPLFGALADKYKMGKVIFMASIAFTAIFFSSIGFIHGNPPEATIHLDCSAITLLKKCNMTDNCTLAKINLENLEHQSLMECKLSCNNSDSSFLNQMCNIWNVSDACTTSLPSIEMTTYSNMSKATFEQSCLYLPIDSITYNQTTQIEHPYCNGAPSIDCNVTCNNPTLMSYIQNPVDEDPDENFFTTSQFQILFWLMIGARASQAVAGSLADSICFSLLGDKPHDYGVQRLWGALGWGLFAIIAGYLIDLASIGKAMKDYTPSFYLVFILLAINILSVSKIRVDYHHEPFAFCKVVSLFKNAKVLLFLFSCATFGSCMGVLYQFLFWYLEDLASAQGGCDSFQWIKLLEGLVMGIQCFLGETPFLFLSGWFLNKLGHVHTMTMILLIMGIRMLAYSFLSYPWYVLPIELLTGVTLGVFWSTMASFAHLIAPPGAETTLQGIFGAVFEGIGIAIGSLLGGYIFERYGGPVMFRCFGGLSLAIGILYSLSNNLLIDRNQIRKKSTRKECYNKVNQDMPKDEPKVMTEIKMFHKEIENSLEKNC